MKRKKMKPVRAWALAKNGRLYEWALATRDDIRANMGVDYGEKFVRVEIREVPKKRKARKVKK